jgi:hypothetical protein
MTLLHGVLVSSNLAGGTEPKNYGYLTVNQTKHGSIPWMVGPSLPRCSYHAQTWKVALRGRQTVLKTVANRKVEGSTPWPSAE